MSKDSKAQHRATRQHQPTKIIVERHYVGTEKMETVINNPGASTQALCSAPTSPLTALAFCICFRNCKSGVC